MSDGIVKWRPSNGTVGDNFISNWCCKCEHDRERREFDGDGCDILGRTFIYDEDAPEYPEEWQDHPTRGPICTAFTEPGEPHKKRCEKTKDMFEEEK